MAAAAPITAFDKQFIIGTIYPCANAAYQVMNVPMPPLALPPGYVVADVIQADPKDAAVAMSQASGDHQRLVSAMIAENSIFGLVAWNAAESTAVIAIRGTRTWKDWLADFDAAPLPYLADPDQGLAHMGFQLVYRHIDASIAGILATKCAGVKRVLVTGHSLGGAAAVLCAFDVAHRILPALKPELYTIAGPRVGDLVFINHFNAAVPICQRMVNFMDVVPQVPLPPVYYHVGHEQLVHGGFRPLDISYAHHLTTYLNGLQKL